MSFKANLTPERRQIMSERNRLSRAHQDEVYPDMGPKMSLALKERYKDPAFKEKQLQAARKANKRSHEARKEKMQSGWMWLADPTNNKRRKLIAPADVDNLILQGWRKV